MKILRAFLFVFGFVAVAAAQSPEALAPNTLRVVAVTGVATWTNAPSGTDGTLQVGQILSEGAAIITGKASGVTLELASGSMVRIDENTDIVVSKFAQESFVPGASDPAAGEPAVSNTEIMLNKGSVTSKVAKLRANSTYSVRTPVGAAGVRGTIFQVIYDPVTRTVEVRTAEGEVVFKGQVPETFEINAGDRIVIEFSSNGQVIVRMTRGRLTEEEILEIIRKFLEVVVPIGEGTPLPLLNFPRTQIILSDDTP